MNKVSGEIEEIIADEMTIGGTTYKIADSLKGLLTGANNDALKGAQITFEIDGDKVSKVTQLTLMNSTGTSDTGIVLDAGGAIIDGSVTVAADYYEVKNLTVNGDFTVTDEVQNSFLADGLHVKGTTHIADEVQPMNARFAMSAVEDPKTRITIVFKDSTTAVIEISKKDMNFSATGSTKITELILMANAAIFANENVIIPKVEIRKGVTHVELNATIADIIIDSNDEITVSGSGNFDNVVINTDKSVHLETTGTIQKLDTTNENSKVTMGPDVQVGTIVVPENKSVGEIITNYDEVKEQIGEITDTIDYFAVGILHVEDRFGYVKLNIKNQGNYQVKYTLAEKNQQVEPAKAGEQVPADAIEYLAGNELILWHGYDLFVYQVDPSGKIIDFVNTNTDWYYPLEWEVTNENILKAKTTIKIDNLSVKDIMQAMYLYNGEQVEKVTDFTGLEWEIEDGLKVMNLELAKNVNKQDPIRMLFHTSRFSTNTITGGYSESGKFDLFVLQDLAKDTNPIITWNFGHILNQIAYELIEKQDAAGNTYWSHESFAEMDSVSIAAYKAELIANEASLQAVEDVKQMVKRINEDLKATIAPYKQARALVDALFKEDRHEYPYDEQLREGVTQLDLDAAKKAVAAIGDEFIEKAQLTSEVNHAEYLLK